MDYSRILQELSQNGTNIITTQMAEHAGVSRAMLSRLCKEGVLQRLAKGQYILPSIIPDELLSISLRTEHLVFSHETALFLHGISDRTPFVHAVTVPSHKVPSPSLRELCKVYYIQPELFEMGRTTLLTPFSNPVPCYDLERTLCDVIRSRNKIGTETFLFALRQYAASNKKDLNLLHMYAKELKLTALVRQYLEVLL